MRGIELRGNDLLVAVTQPRPRSMNSNHSKRKNEYCFKRTFMFLFTSDTVSMSKTSEKYFIKEDYCGTTKCRVERHLPCARRGAGANVRRACPLLWHNGVKHYNGVGLTELAPLIFYRADTNACTVSRGAYNND